MAAGFGLLRLFSPIIFAPGAFFAARFPRSTGARERNALEKSGSDLVCAHLSRN
jgi:hypothetical protein